MGKMIAPKKKIIIIRKMYLYLSIKLSKSRALSYGRSAESILEPSSGGIGIRLNRNNEMLIRTIYERIKCIGIVSRLCAERTLIKMPKIMAMQMLAKTPAKEVIMRPRL